jgi:hypothetical protein
MPTDVSRDTATTSIREWVVPIVVAFVGVTAAAAPVLVSSLFSRLTNEPEVEIEINTRNEGATVTLRNEGVAPATNLTLVVYAPEKIAISSNYTRYTVEVSPVKIDDERLEAYLPKLVQGSGSIVTLDIILENQTVVDYYVAYVTYDQGSLMKDSSQPSDYFSLFLISLTFGFIVFYAVYLFFLYRYGIRRRRRVLNKMFMSNVTQNIVEIRRALKDNNKIDTIFNNAWKVESLTETKSARSYLVRRIIVFSIYRSYLFFRERIPLLREEKKEVRDTLQKKELRDYLILDDFYAKLERRIIVFIYAIYQGQLEKFNKYCLQLADNALRNIKWEKYS